jgi:hypothetical protein
MLWSDDERELAKAPPVKVELRREAIELIEAALDLVAVDTAVDYGDIDSGLSMCKAKLIDHDGLRRISIGLQPCFVQRCADIGIAYREHATHVVLLYVSLPDFRA